MAPSFPTPRQEMLLSVILGPEDARRRTWATFASGFDPDKVDPAERRLLPLLYRELARNGVEGPVMDSLRRTYFLSVAQNSNLIRKTRRVLDGFNQAHIPTLVLKGIPLVLNVYQDVGARIMADVDLAVRAKDAPAAIAVLINLGFTPLRSAPVGSDLANFAKFRAYRNADEFKTSDGFVIDLHWHIFAENLTDETDEMFWSSAQAIDVGGASTLSLSPEDMILHVCIHGLRRGRFPSLRWVADLVHVLSVRQDLDWRLLSTRALRLGYGFAIAEMLDYVATKFQARVCSKALATLRAGARKWERREFRVLTTQSGIWSEVLFYIYRFRRILLSSPDQYTWASFITYLRALSGAGSFRDFVFHAAGECLRRWRPT